MQTEERQRKWDLRFMKVAEEAASWSKDPSTKVGCVITNRNHIVSVGYNGFPAGQSDDPGLYADREYKYKHVIHAEHAAIDGTHNGYEPGSTAYVTFPPCCSCCEKLVRAGVVRIVAKKIDDRGRPVWWCLFWKQQLEASVAFAELVGVPLEIICD